MPDDAGTIQIADEILRAGFTQIPNVVLRRRDLSTGAKLTYVALLSYAWQEGSCYPGQERLAADVGVTDRSVRNHLAELVRAGLLTVQRRGQGLTNVYTLESLLQGREERASAQDARPERGSGQKRNHVPRKKTQAKQTQRNGSKPPHGDWAYATDTPRVWKQTYRAGEPLPDPDAAP